MLIRIGAAAVAVGMLLVGCGPSTDADPTTPPTPPPTPSATATPSPTAPAPAPTPSPKGTGAAGLIAGAKAALDTLPVKGRAPKTGYDREGQFGAAWLDTDANGCDTRNDILRRDLTQLVMRDACIVERGRLADPYSGLTIEFERGVQTSSKVQIDHVVALSNAWQTGAQQLTYEERVAFANDPLELLAVDGALNQQKGDGDAATWLPPNRAYRCEYVSRQVMVKQRWGLWLTPPEHDAIERILAGC